MITLDLHSRQPIYEQLREKIIEIIMLGEIGPDEQLPSVRSLAGMLGINPNTVQKAYQDLERDGIIYSAAGRGSFINPDAGASGKLRENRLEQIRHSASRAAASGVPEDDALSVVREVYGKLNRRSDASTAQ